MPQSRGIDSGLGPSACRGKSMRVLSTLVHSHTPSVMISAQGCEDMALGCRPTKLCERMKRNRSLNSDLHTFDIGSSIMHTGLSGGLDQLDIAAPLASESQPPKLEARKTACTRSKGQALVEAALETLTVGSHADHAGCGFMEDRHITRRGTGMAFFGVFDGHGGADVAQYCQEHLYLNMLQSDHLLGEDESTRRALQDGFSTTEREVMDAQKAAGKDGSGATALALVLSKGGRSLNLAWVGDCRAVLCREGTAIALTSDHRLRRQRERARVLRDGGTIEGDRLGGYLAVSRAVGDFDAAAQAKPAGLSAVPELRSEALRQSDEFVLLATDGLWDVMSPEEAVRIASTEFRAYDDAQIVAEKLVEAALARHTDDNVTVMAVRLFPPRKPEERVQAPKSFVEIETAPSFVRVVGGFDA